MNKENVEKETEIIKINQTEILEWKNLITKLKIHHRDSTAYLSKQTKQSVNLKIGHLKLSSLRHRKRRE